MNKTFKIILRKFDFSDVNIARKWFVELVGDLLILALAGFLGYTIKTFFI